MNEPRVPSPSNVIWGIAFEPILDVQDVDSLTLIVRASGFHVNLRVLEVFEEQALRIEPDRNEFLFDRDGYVPDIMYQTTNRPVDPLPTLTADILRHSWNSMAAGLDPIAPEPRLVVSSPPMSEEFRLFVRRFFDLDVESPVSDNATEELLALAKSGDRAGFKELASVLMPMDEVDECWEGTRRRLRLPVDSEAREPDVVDYP